MHFEKPAALAVQGRPQQSHDETGCQMTGDKFRADGYIKASRPDQNKVSPLDSLAWSDASSEMRCKFVADIGGRAWLAAMPPEWLPELERSVEQHRVANLPPPLPSRGIGRWHSGVSAKALRLRNVRPIHDIGFRAAHSEPREDCAAGTR